MGKPTLKWLMRRIAKHEAAIEKERRRPFRTPMHPDIVELALLTRLTHEEALDELDRIDSQGR